MPTYVETCNCRGTRPIGVIGTKHNSRPELVGQLLRDRGVVRFLIAPTGYGKSTIAFEYAHIVFSFKHVFWMRCESPCFLRDLDADTLLDSLIASDPDLALVVFEDVPSLDQDRSERFDALLNALLDRNCEVIVTCTPSANSFSNRQYDNITLKATDLILSDDEMVIEEMRGNIHQDWRGSIRMSERAPALRWGDGGADRILSGVQDEDLPADIKLVILGLLTLGEGALDEIDRLISPERTSDAIGFLCDNYPFIGIDARCGTYSAFAADLAPLVKALNALMDELVVSSIHRSREGLCSCIADILIEKESYARACEFMERIATKAMVNMWLTRHGWGMLSAIAAFPVAKLYISLNKNARSSHALYCIKAWTSHILGDTRDAVEFGERVLASSGASLVQRCSALAVIALNGERREMTERFDTLLVDDSSAISKRIPEIKEKHAEDGFCSVDWIAVASVLALVLRNGYVADEAWRQVFTDTWCAEGEALPFVDSDGIRIAHAPGADDRTKLLAADCLLRICFENTDDYTAESATSRSLSKDTFTSVAEFIHAKLEASMRTSDKLDWISFSAGCALEEICTSMDLRHLVFDKKVASSLRKTELEVFSQKESYRRLKTEEAQKKTGGRNGIRATFREEDSDEGAPTSGGAGIPLLRVNLFGGLDVHIGDEPVDARLISRRKTKIALALLVINRGHELSRDRIAQILWPDSGLDSYKRNFYGIWSQLKKALSVNGRCPYLIRAQSGCSIDPRFLSSDLIAFEDLCRALLFGSDDPVSWERLYAQVNEDFRDELMPSETENPYIVALREKYREQLSDGLIATSSRLNSMNEPRGALWFAKEALRRNSKREDAYIALMEAQIASNQRGAALETYFACRKFLSEELGIDPSLRVIELYRSIIETEEMI